MAKEYYIQLKKTLGTPKINAQAGSFHKIPGPAISDKMAKGLIETHQAIAVTAEQAGVKPKADPGQNNQPQPVVIPDPPTLAELMVEFFGLEGLQKLVTDLGLQGERTTDDEALDTANLIIDTYKPEKPEVEPVEGLIKFDHISEDDPEVLELARRRTYSGEQLIEMLANFGQKPRTGANKTEMARMIVACRHQEQS